MCNLVLKVVNKGPKLYSFFKMKNEGFGLKFYKDLIETIGGNLMATVTN